MIPTLKAIGDYALNKGKDSLLEQIIENPNSNGKYNTVLVIVFKETMNEIKYDRVKMEEFSEKKLAKYAYKRGAARGGDFTPTSKIVDITKAFKRIQLPLRKVADYLKGKTKENKKSDKIILSINEIISKEEVAQKILEDLKEINYNDAAILTIAYKDIDKKDLSYVGDFKQFITTLKESYEKEFYYIKSFPKNERIAIGEDNFCYLCGRKMDKTYGFVRTFSFYTLDKVGFASGGFNRGDAWKNYPVCPDCAVALDYGRKYIERNLASRFCGIDYFIIPKTILDTGVENETEIYEILEELEEKKKFSLKDKNRAALTSTKDELFGVMKDFANYFNFNLMFYREDKTTGVFRILLYVEDVLPSYIGKIFEVKDEVERDELFHELHGKDGEYFDLNFTFNLIAEFFPIKNYEKTFLEITNDIFSQKRISYELMLAQFMKDLRERFCQGENMGYANLKAFMILQFLMKLDLLKGRREGLVKMETNKTAYENIEGFFAKYPEFFDSDIKRAAFLEGVLAKKLLNIQRLDRGATPFRERLNGLKIDEKIVKRLLPEMQNKLDEYKKNYYRKLEELISRYLLVSDFNEISNTEISFYFTTGLNLAGEFEFSKKEKVELVEG